MTLLDAYALIAFVIGGPAAPQVRSLLREGDTAVTTANLVEVLDVSERVHHVPMARTTEILEPLFDTTITSVSLDRDRSERAAGIRARHHDPSHCPISLADAVLLASAEAGDRIATADPDVLSVANSEGIDTIVLPGQG